MIETALQICVAAVAVSMLLCTWRLWRGPSAPDRILAIDTLYINALALLVVLGMLLLGLTWQTALLFEAALIVAMLGFVSTVALARFITRGDVIE